MGRQHALEAIHLRMTERIPNWIGVPLHPEFIEKVTGLDLFSNPRDASIRAIEALELDVADYFETTTAMRIAPGETLDVAGGKVAAFNAMGVGGSRGETFWHEPAEDIHDIEDVLGFDVTRHQCYKEVDEFKHEIGVRSAVIEEHRRVLGERAWVPDPVDWYNTVFMWGVTTFGWERFLTTAALEPERYSLLLDRLTMITKRYFTAAASLNGLVLAQAHDDLCMSRGSVFHPEWYRKYIFPRYPELLAPLKERGVKVIYRGDGNVDGFIDDLAAAGFDGFIVRDQTDLATVAARYGSTKVIMGNISTTVVTFKGKTEIEDEVKRCVRQAGHCPGYMLRVAGELPSNVPTDNLFYLFDAVKKYSRR